MIQAAARPIVVIEGDTAWASARANAVLEQMEQAGWTLADPPAGTAAVNAVWRCVISDAADAQQALLSVLNGGGLVALVRCDRDVADRFLDDLRRLGTVDHITADERAAPALTSQQRALLALLAEGLTLAEAAWQLGLSRRTADRRLAAARRVLAVRTTAEAIIAVRALQR